MLYISTCGLGFMIKGDASSVVETFACHCGQGGLILSPAGMNQLLIQIKELVDAGILKADKLPANFTDLITN